MRKTRTRPPRSTFEISSSVDDTMEALNIITAMLAAETLMLTLTPGTGAASSKLWQQETVAITATDDEGGRGTVSFAVTDASECPNVGELAPAHGFIIQGDAGGDELGISVAGAGDVNGDGLADLITGANLGDDGTANAGEAYIIYGKTGTGTQFGAADSTTMRRVVNATSLVPADGFIIQGDAPSNWLGFSVAGAGDVNGDGIDDLITGAPDGDDGGDLAGEAYIVYGKAGTQFGTAVETAGVMRQVVDTTNLKPADGFIIQGDAGGDALGRSVSGVGDINGDGIDDLVVGASDGDDGGGDAGEAYIVYGKAGDGTQFGTAVRVAADGTTTLDITASDAVGSIVRQVLDTSMLAPADGFIIQGDVAGDELGRSVSGAGDINGDGLADLIVGGTGGDDGGGNAGEAYIIYGKAGTAGTQFGLRVAIAGSTTTTLTIENQAAPMNSVVRRVLDTTSLSVTDGFISRAMRRATSWVFRFREPAISMATGTTISSSGPMRAAMAVFLPGRPISSMEKPAPAPSSAWGMEAARFWIPQACR